MTDVSRAVALLKEGEGAISHMYLDTRGNVTVGVGQLLSTVDSAKKLRFTVRISNKLATAAEIETDFNTVKKQRAGALAASYKQHTKLDLPTSVIDALLGTRIQEFESQLRTSLHEYDRYPPDAQLAILDMAFNLGTNGLISKFPRLVAAIREKDWNECASLSNRVGIGAARNEKTKQLFLAAAAE